MLNEDVMIGAILIVVPLVCVLSLLFLFWTLGRYSWLRHKKREVDLALRVRVDGFRSLYGKVLVGFSLFFLVFPWLALLLYITASMRLPIDLVATLMPGVLLYLSLAFPIRAVILARKKRRHDLLTDQGAKMSHTPEITGWMIIKKELLLHGVLLTSVVILWITMALMHAFITPPVFYVMPLDVI